MYVILTKSGISFIYKMIREIISVPRGDWGYPHNFGVNSWVFKDESETEAKTNIGHRVCLLLVRSPLLVCTEHAQCLLSACHVNTHTHTHTPICNFLTKSWPYLNIEGPLFRIQSVRKFGSAVCSLNVSWCNYFTYKVRISHAFCAKSGRKLPLLS